jgi:hypothetical protein
MLLRLGRDDECEQSQCGRDGEQRRHSGR